MTTFDSEWVRIISDVLYLGKDISPRGTSTKELIGTSISFDMRSPILENPKRNIGTAFLCAEPAWILSGDNCLETIKKYAPQMERFSDDDVFLSGAYSPKVVDQFPYIIKCLSEDMNSRQAVMNIWREKPGSSKDTPCTLNYQFLIRQDRLHLISSMRSNDLWLGTVYDVFTQTMIAYATCLLLRKKYSKLTLGMLYLNVGSSHIYENNRIEASDAASSVYVSTIPFQLEYDYSLTFTQLKEYLWDCAKTLINGSPVAEGFLSRLMPKGSDQVLTKSF